MTKGGTYAVGWFRSLFARALLAEKQAFARLMAKAETQGLEALSAVERTEFQACLSRLEGLINSRLSTEAKEELRRLARNDFAKAFPRVAEELRRQVGQFHVHHRIPLDFAHLFPLRDINAEEPYLSTLLFGQIPMLAYYLATVPSLADSRGVQPVVFIDGYEEGRVLPVASNVDLFLTLFSVYLERAVATPEFTLERRMALHFPASVWDVVAQDQSLVTVLSSGLFDGLCNGEESREWISKVTGARRGS